MAYALDEQDSTGIKKILWSFSHNNGHDKDTKTVYVAFAANSSAAHKLGRHVSTAGSRTTVTIHMS